jgi:hypothetical protein
LFLPDYPLDHLFKQIKKGPAKRPDSVEIPPLAPKTTPKELPGPPTPPGQNIHKPKFGVSEQPDTKFLLHSINKAGVAPVAGNPWAWLANC